MITRAHSRTELVTLTLRAEAAGFSGVCVPDHLHRQLAPLPTLAMVAALSPLRVGTLVLSNEFRQPVVLAKELASLDLLTDGRLDVGLGLGWNRSEFAAGGLAFPPYEVRLERLRETLAVLRGFWTGQEFRHDGEHFHVKALVGDPRPVQRPHPPLVLPLGAGPSLELAAAEADVVEVGCLGASESVVSDRLDELERALPAGRARPVRRCLLMDAAHRTDHPRLRGEADRLATTIEDLVHRPAFLAGSPDRVVEELRRRREVSGISSWTVPEDLLDVLTPAAGRLAGG